MMTGKDIPKVDEHACFALHQFLPRAGIHFLVPQFGFLFHVLSLIGTHTSGHPRVSYNGKCLVDFRVVFVWLGDSPPSLQSGPAGVSYIIKA